MAGLPNDVFRLRGPSAYVDVSANGNNGTAVGAMSIVSDTDFGGVSAFAFNGSSYISLGTLDVTSLTTCSVGLWVKSPSGTNQRAFSLRHSNFDDIRVFVDSGGVGPSNFATDDGTAFQANFGAAGTDGNWHLLVGTFDGTTVRSYYDGVLANTTGSASFNFATAQGLCAVGNFAGGLASVPLDAGSRVDDVGFSSSVWEAGLIAAWYAAGRGYDAPTFTRRQQRSQQIIN
jgi:hypothetical protein